MSTVPKITHEEWLAAVSALPANHDYRPSDIANKALATKYNLAEQQEITAFAKKRSGMEFDEWQGKPPPQESEYITAAQARELVEAGSGSQRQDMTCHDFWHTCKLGDYFGDEFKYRATKQAQPVSWNTKYSDSTPNLSVGNSAFEDWFQAQEFATLVGVKQMCRDSYAAGMGDPLVTYATTQAQPEPVDPHAALRAEYIRQRDAVPCELGFYEWEFLSFAKREWRVIPIGEKPAFMNPLQYRCTDISCYVSKDGEPAIRMLQIEAQELQRQTKDTHDWFTTGGALVVIDLLFSQKGTYTYRTKATIKLGGNMVTPEQAATEWEAKKETHDVWIKNDPSGSWFKTQLQPRLTIPYSQNNNEYELRPKQPTWTGSREDVLALLRELGLL